jgi:hypothetical protein
MNKRMITNSEPKFKSAKNAEKHENQRNFCHPKKAFIAPYVSITAIITEKKVWHIY